MLTQQSPHELAFDSGHTAHFMSPQALKDLAVMPEILQDTPKPLPFPVIWDEFTAVTGQNGEVCFTTEIIQGQAEVSKSA